MATVDDRSVLLAKHIIATNDTVRKTAKLYGISKSTVHKDVSARLQKVNKALYLEVKKVLDQNKNERHIRGGMATKEKFQREKEIKNKELEEKSLKKGVL